MHCVLKRAIRIAQKGNDWVIRLSEQSSLISELAKPAPVHEYIEQDHVESHAKAKHLQIGDVVDLPLEYVTSF
jgi:hypothetical protein